MRFSSIAICFLSKSTEVIRAAEDSGKQTAERMRRTVRGRYFPIAEIPGQRNIELMSINGSRTRAPCFGVLTFGELAGSIMHGGETFH